MIVEYAETVGQIVSGVMADLCKCGETSQTFTSTEARKRWHKRHKAIVLADRARAGSKVVLTTAHRNHVPEDCDPENLFGACQGCHLHYDRDHHAQTAAATRARALVDAGQEVLPL